MARVLRGDGRQPLTITRSTAETAGELLEMEAEYAPGSAPPPAHYHPRQEERFLVLEGELRVLVDGTEGVLAQGEELVLPAGSRHAVWNAGARPARTRWQIRPALRSETFFETVWGLAEAGRTRSDGGLPLLRAAPIAVAHRNEFRLDGPPYPLQLAVCALLVPWATFLGYRSRPRSRPTGDVRRRRG